MSASQRIVHLILNPVAGHGRAGRQLRRIIRTLHEDGCAVEEYVTARPMHAATIARALPGDGAPLCIAGGDGTLNEVINGLRPGAHPVGILPLGTGNDFARVLGIRSMRDTLDALLQDSKKSVDAVRADVVDEEENVISRHFINALGIGFDAAVAVDVSRRRFGSGMLPYLLAVLRVLRNYRSVPSTTILQNRELTASLFLACIGNGTTSGGGFMLTPRARVDDGVLDLCHVREVGIGRVLQVLPRALRGTHIHAPEVTYHQGAHLDIRLDYPLPVHVDGEILTHRARRVIASCQPGAYSVYVP